jgi:hypothetical protein
MTNNQDFGSVEPDPPEPESVEPESVEPESVEPESVESVRSDIEATRGDLVETVTELSDRLNPTKRVAAVAQGVSESAKDVVDQAGEVTKDTAAKAHDVAKVGVRRGRQISDGREAQLIGVAVLVVGLVLLWRRRRGQR